MNYILIWENAEKWKKKESSAVLYIFIVLVYLNVLDGALYIMYI